MKKKCIYIILILTFVIFIPKNVFALNRLQILDCGSNSLLGSTNDPDSVAWLVQKIFNYIRIIGPFLVLLLSSIDYVKVILGADDDSMKKTNKKLITRLILAGALFILPTLVSLLLNITGIISADVCIR